MEQNQIRNFAIISHVDHGKSTLADRFLELTHTVESRHMRAQYLDRMDLERERGITIKLQPCRMLWHPTLINADSNADKRGLLYEDLTYKIRGAMFKVYNQLGPGHKEIIYQKALEKELININLNYEREKNIDVKYDNKKIGNYVPDFIVENKILVELKALPFVGKLEKKQIWSYLKSTNYRLALLVNFGSDKLQIDRIVYDTIRDHPRDNQRKSAAVVLNLIDTPGHVDFSYEVSRSLAAVEGAILLVDASQGIQAQTLANLHQAQQLGLDIIPVVNKIDLPNADIESATVEMADLLKIAPSQVLKVSAKTGENVQSILNTLVGCIMPPQGDPNKPLRALVFDSTYDPYRGVVAYVKIVDGKIKKGDKIKFMATGIEDEALEVGYFSPDYTSKESLSAGEIGYIVTGLKEVSECKVGDTITLINADKKSNVDQRGYNISGHPRENPRQLAIQPLAGYKEVVAMVFAGIYSTDGEVNKLREALAKLKLNDASFSVESESSQAFGSGFRCGFLGTLHLEIVKERLEREYGLNLIITTPQVKYLRESATGLQDQRSSASYKEPWVRVEVITPQQYIGPIMELFNSVRGMYKSTQYLGDRAILEYDSPLSSIIINFYDRLKSLSAGYASMNYQLIGYRPGNLVKMDLLVAGEKVDVLSQIVDKSQLQQKAQHIVKRLKELIPRQWFEISLQAAVGGKILARENIPALKKDVTGYLYGGDITRKKKLWAKQAKGKKKMKRLGKVDIPTDVFMKLLKN